MNTTREFDERIDFIPDPVQPSGRVRAVDFLNAPDQPAAQSIQSPATPQPTYYLEHAVMIVFLVMVGLIIYSVYRYLRRTPAYPFRKLKLLLVLGLILTCLIPPWQYTEDVNGSSGAHSRSPAGYYLVLEPPRPISGRGHGVTLDFSRLFLQWTGLAGAGVFIFLLTRRPQAN